MPAAIPGSYIGLNGMEWGPPQDHRADPAAASSPRQQVIDGTPARVAALGVASLAILIGLRWAGIKFNVAVSS